MVPDSISKPLRSYTKGKFDQFKDIIPLPEVPSTYMYKYAPSIGTPWKRVDTVLKLIETEFDSLGGFLSYLFHNRDYGIPDPRTPKHCSVVASFLLKLIDLLSNLKVNSSSRQSSLFTYCIGCETFGGGDHNGYRFSSTR
jgi:hypothetical protein